MNNLGYRSVALNVNSAPKTFDPETRSVEVVAATENPTQVFDWERLNVVNEILLMDGMKMNGSQLPLLDSHMRSSVENVKGSFRDMRIEDGKLIGRAYFADTPDNQSILRKIQEGHITDFSIGYRVDESTYIPEGQRQVINGREFQGPVKVSTKWTPKEISICPIGADEMAKVRMDLQPKPKEVKTMDEKLRKFLESRGLASDATEDEAWRFLEKLDIRETKPEPHTTYIDAIRADVERLAAKKEQERILEIRALCERFGKAEMADELIKRGASISDAGMEILKKLGEESNGVVFRKSIEIVESERDRFRAAATDAILLRAGKKIEKPAPGAEDLMGFSLKELARESLRRANQPIYGDTMQMVSRAITTSDLPYVLQDVVNKSLFEGYQTASETWQVWCDIGSVSDFKKHKLIKVSELDDLDEITEENEYKYGSISDQQEEYKIATYGKLFKISRQTIINDDLGALTDIPAKHGEAAARKIGDIVYSILTTNPTMGDGVALFHSSHGNIGTPGTISETTIAEAIKLMRMQKDMRGKRRLNIVPQYIILPVSLEGKAEIFFNSTVFTSDNAGSTRTNPYAGNRFTRVYEPRLDDASETAWFMAGPKGKTIKVFFLNGNQTPYLETRDGWSIDGVEYKVRIDAGAAAVDWKALVKNAGA
jgi:hypothetical protein